MLRKQRRPCHTIFGIQGHSHRLRRALEPSAEVQRANFSRKMFQRFFSLLFLGWLHHLTRLVLFYPTVQNRLLFRIVARPFSIGELGEEFPWPDARTKAHHRLAIHPLRDWLQTPR